MLCDVGARHRATPLSFSLVNQVCLGVACTEPDELVVLRSRADRGMSGAMGTRRSPFLPMYKRLRYAIVSSPDVARVRHPRSIARRQTERGSGELVRETT